MNEMNNSKDHVVWLASYPKTGSTWLREIIASIITQDAKGKAAIPSFQNVWSADYPTYTLWGEPTTIIKTHLYPEHRAMLRPQLSLKAAVLIRRHPLDILLSALNYAMVREEKDAFLNNVPKTVENIIADGEFPHYIESFRETDGFPWFSGPSGGLSLFADRWRDHMKDHKYHEICYEELFSDPESHVHALLAFFEQESTPGSVERIMKQADRRTSQNGKFFWKRRAYNFQELLPETLVDLFYDRCQAQILGSGYDPKQQ